MAKLKLRRQADGNYTVRGFRMEGKALAKNVVVKHVTQKDLHAEIVKVMDVVSPKKSGQLTE